MSSRFTGRRASAVVAACLGVLGAAALLPALAHSARSVYVSSFTDEALAGYSMSGSGQLVEFAQYGLGGSGEGVAITPDGKHLYVNLYGDAAVAGFEVAADGGLTPLTGSPFAAGTQPLGIAISPDGTLLATANFGSDDVSLFSVGSDGGLTPVQLSPFGTGGKNPFGVGFAPDGDHLYVVNFGGGPAPDSLTTFAVASDNSLGAVAPPLELTDAFASGIAVSPDGEFLFVSIQSHAQVHGFSLESNGLPTPLAGSPFAITIPGTTISITPDQQHLYLGGGGPTAVDIAADGSLTERDDSPFAGGAGAASTGVTPDGKRLYAAFQTSDTIHGYNVLATGDLSEITNSPFIPPESPDFQSVAITPNQGPGAAFSTGAQQALRGGAARTADAEVDFDGGTSTDGDGTIARYDWSFGDGTSLPDGGPTPTHAYAEDGTYEVQLTVTDNEGCADELIFTGQTAYCNGGAAATATQEVVVDTVVTGAKLTGKGKQRQRGKRIVVKVDARAGEPVALIGTGAVEHGKRSYTLRKVEASVDDGQKRKLRLKPRRKRDARKISRALREGERLTAEAKVKFTDDFGNRTRLTRTVKLR